jgi:beta-lactamase class A
VDAVSADGVVENKNQIFQNYHPALRAPLLSRRGVFVESSARNLPHETVMKQLGLFITVILLVACVRQDIPVQSSGVPAQPSPSPTASPANTPLTEKIDTALQTELAKIAEAAKGRVGVGAVMLETGEAAYLDGHGQYPMQSVYKLPIAMAVLKMVDEGKVRIDQEVSITPDDFVRQGFHSPIRNANPQGVVMPLVEIIRFSISESDGTASDVLLDLAGGPIELQRYLATVGNGKEMIIADSEKSIGKDWDTQYQNWSSPDASIKLLRALHERRAGLSESTTSLLLKLMTETETGDRRIKHGLPEGASLAHKTGTGGTENGITGATNDIGIITLPDGRHILLAVYVSDSPENGAVREKVIADIAKASIEKWAPGSYPEKATGANGADFNTRHTLQ